MYSMRLRAAGYVAAFLDGVVVTMETRYVGWATALAHLSVNHPRSAGCTQLASVPSLSSTSASFRSPVLPIRHKLAGVVFWPPLACLSACSFFCKITKIWVNFH